MALVVKDRVQETTTTVGTGTVTLGGAVLSFQTFAAIGNGNTTYYAIVDPIAGAWEAGIGTYTASGTTLSRDTVLSSSNGGSLVSFGAGTKNVICTYPSERAIYLDSAGSYPVQNTFNTLVAATATLAAGTVAATPTTDLSIANKQYVDTVAAEGIHYHEAVYVESPNTAGNLTATYTSGGTNANIIQIANGTDITFFSVTPSVGDQFLTSTGNGLLANTPYYIVADLGSNTYQISLTYGGAVLTGLTNGTPTLPSLINPGIGATLTNAGTQVALTIDGILMTTTKRVLIYNQTNAFENGIYTVTTVGTGSTNWVLTRATDADTYAPSSSLALGQGDAFYVTNGNTGAGETYVVTTNGDIFFGITAINFAQISSAQVYSAGTGLNLSPATTFNISNVGTAGTYGGANSVPVFTTNAQGQVTTVTPTSIAISSAAVSGLAASATTDTTNASNITTGTLDTSRLSGSYTGVTGVGTLTAGTWNATAIGPVYGGTGFTSYAVGDIVYADTTTSLAKLPDVAVGNALISGGVAAAPSWGKIGLATHVSGTLPIANGGTGSTSTQFVALGTNVSGTLPIANGGTGVDSTTTTDKFFFAAPNASSGAPTFRAIVASDVPTLNQSTTGSAATLTTSRAIYGNNFDGSAALTQVIASTYGGTGNGFTKFSGPATAEKTFTLPDANATILTTNAAVTVAQGGTGATTLTANNVLLGNGTSAPQFVAPGTNGNVLTSNGTTWTSAAAGGGFAAGTAILFYQAAAPTGWTKSTANDNKAIRVVTGATGGSAGGTTAFSTVFSNQTPTITTSGLSAGATTLALSQVPSHTHNIDREGTECGSPGTVGSYNYSVPNYTMPLANAAKVFPNGGGGSHSHSISGSATSSAVTLNVQYIDVIVCTKN